MLMTPDKINGLYEGLGALFVLGHCWNLWKSKQPWGVSILGVIFFTSWGVWNLYYYPSLNQWWSFSGGLAIVLCNSLYVGLLIYLRKRFPDKTTKEPIESLFKQRKPGDYYWCGFGWRKW
jgi:hypothetical protein